MKRFLYHMLVLMLCVPCIAAAQPKGPVKEKIESIRHNTYARVLQLTDDESKRFWPVFDQMENEMLLVRRDMNKERRNVEDNYASINDADMTKSIDRMLALEQKLLDIRKKYTLEFEKVLPVKKVAMLPRAEREFKKELIQQIKDFREPGE